MASTDTIDLDSSLVVKDDQYSSNVIRFIKRCNNNNKKLMHIMCRHPHHQIDEQQLSLSINIVHIVDNIPHHGNIDGPLSSAEVYTSGVTLHDMSIKICHNSYPSQDTTPQYTCCAYAD